MRVLHGVGEVRLAAGAAPAPSSRNRAAIWQQFFLKADRHPVGQRRGVEVKLGVLDQVFNLHPLAAGKVDADDEVRLLLRQRHIEERARDSREGHALEEGSSKHGSVLRERPHLVHGVNAPSHHGRDTRCGAGMVVTPIPDGDDLATVVIGEDYPPPSEPSAGARRGFEDRAIVIPPDDACREPDFACVVHAPNLPTGSGGWQ